MITTQEVFNMVWNHFVVEKGKPSISVEGGPCRYRGDGGAKCAVGLFIPDDRYTWSLEGLDMGDRRVCDALPPAFHDREGRVPDALYYLLDELQRAHDKNAVWGSDFHNSMEAGLRLIAARRRLQIPT